MFGKIINSYYYGKSGKGDYNKEDLPQNRWQLFWEMLRVRFSGIVRLNLMYAVAWLPALIVIGLGILAAYTGLVEFSEVQMKAEAGEVAAEAVAEASALFQNNVKGLIFQTLLLLIPCIAITGPVTAGVSYVTRNWARDEHAFIWSDFRDALKENWKQAIAVSLITGFVPLVLYVCYSFYGEMAGSQVLFIIPQILSIMVALLWLCSLMYMYPLLVTYKLRFRDLIRNGFLLAVARLPMTVGFKLLSVVPALIFVLVSLYTPYMQYAIMILFLYYIVLGYALSRFVYASYTNGVFDKYINSKIEGAEVNRGLYVDDEPENDAAEEDGE